MRPGSRSRSCPTARAAAPCRSPRTRSSGPGQLVPMPLRQAVICRATARPCAGSAYIAEGRHREWLAGRTTAPDAAQPSGSRSTRDQAVRASARRTTPERWLVGAGPRRRRSSRRRRARRRRGGPRRRRGRGRAPGSRAGRGPRVGRKTSCWCSAAVPALMAPPARLAFSASRSPGDCTWRATWLDRGTPAPPAPRRPPSARRGRRAAASSTSPRRARHVRVRPADSVPSATASGRRWSSGRRAGTAAPACGPPPGRRRSRRTRRVDAEVHGAGAPRRRSAVHGTGGRAPS